jgi:hypothetical protein
MHQSEAVGGDCRLGVTDDHLVARSPALFKTLIQKSKINLNCDSNVVHYFIVHESIQLERLPRLVRVDDMKQLGFDAVRYQKHRFRIGQKIELFPHGSLPLSE